MANPRIPVVIEVTFDSNVTVGQSFRVMNTANGEVIYGEVASGKKGVIECANFQSGVTIGDKIEVKANGNYFGGATHTLVSGKNTVDLSSMTQDTSPKIDL